MLLRIADLNIEVPFELLEDAKAYARTYCMNDTPTIRSSAYDTPRYDNKTDIVVHSDICELGEQLPLYNRMIVHGVAISVDGTGFLFTAPSGTGKSTHAFLWQRLLGKQRVAVINGDKPIVRLSDTEVSPMIYGTPWCGKEGLHQPVGMPLKGMLLLSRDENPHIEPVSRENFFDFMTDQIFLPRNKEALKRTFGILEQLYEYVPVYRLYADMSRNCIELAARTLMNDEDN